MADEPVCQEIAPDLLRKGIVGYAVGERTLHISAHRGRRFRLIVDAISAGSWTAFQIDRGRCFKLNVDDFLGGYAQVIF
jgi:hypothetical protein